MIQPRKITNLLSSTRRRGALLAAAVLATLVVPIVAASASVPNSVTGAITACVKNTGGAVRIVDAQAGVACAADERALSWPGVGGAATQYYQGSPVPLSHDRAQLTTVILGPVLPAGIWQATAVLTVENFTGARDIMRCGLYTGAGALITGSGDNGDGLISITLPGLVTLTSPERINVACAHDNFLPAGLLQANYGTVVVERVTSRF